MGNKYPRSNQEVTIEGQLTPEQLEVLNNLPTLEDNSALSTKTSVEDEIKIEETPMQVESEVATDAELTPEQLAVLANLPDLEDAESGSAPLFGQSVEMLQDAQRTLAKDKYIAQATAPTAIESDSKFKMPKVNLTAQAEVDATQPLKNQVARLLAPKQDPIVEAEFVDFANALPYTQNSAIQNQDNQQLSKHTIRSFFPKNEDGTYTLPNGKKIYSDALLEQYINEYYQRYNHPILMQDDNYRRDYIMRNYGKTEEKFIADTTAQLNEQLDRIEAAYEQARPKRDSSVAYPHMPVDDRPYSAIRSLRDIRKKINSITKDNFWSGLSETFDIDDIIALGIPSIGTAANQLIALNKYNNGEKLTADEKLLVELSKLSQEIDVIRGEYRNDSGFSANRVGQIVGFMPSFAVQLGVTGGALPKVGSKVVKDITLKTAAQAWKESALSGLAQISKKISLSALNDAIATPFTPMAYKSFLDRRLGHIAWEDDNLIKETTPWGKDLLKAMGETFVERHSEAVGEWITSGLAYGGKRLAQTKLLDNTFGRGARNLSTYKMPQVLNDLRKEMRISGFTGEVGSEVYNNIINPIFTQETDSWKELMTGRYWKELLASTAIMSGSFYAMNIPGIAAHSRAINNLRKNNIATLQGISNEGLRDMLQSVFANDNLTIGLDQLSGIDWQNISVGDAQKASRYVYDTIIERLLTSEDAEMKRMQAFAPVLRNITSSLYYGAEASKPTIGSNIAIATLNDGELASITTGDYTNPEAQNITIRLQNGSQKIVPMSSIASVEEFNMSDMIAEQYALMFGASINKEKLQTLINDITTAQQSGASADVIGDIMNNSGYAIFNTGDRVLMSDGSEAIVEAYYGNGTYRVVDPANPEVGVNVGFLNLIQNNPELAQAQRDIIADIENGNTIPNPEAYKSEENIRREKLNNAAKALADDTGKDIYTIQLEDGREATVREGNIVFQEDGTIDRELSDQTIVIKHTDDNTLQQIGIEEIAAVLDIMPVEEAVEAANSNIEQDIAKHNKIQSIFNQQGYVTVTLIDGGKGTIREIIDNNTYIVSDIGKNGETYSLPITLNDIQSIDDAIAEQQPETEVVPESKENVATPAVEIDSSNVDWDKLSPQEYLDTSIVLNGSEQTLALSRIYYKNTEPKLATAQERVAEQQRVIKDLNSQYGNMSNPKETQNLQNEIADAEEELQSRVEAVKALEQELERYAYAISTLEHNMPAEEGETTNIPGNPKNQQEISDDEFFGAVKSNNTQATQTSSLADDEFFGATRANKKKSGNQENSKESNTFVENNDTDGREETDIRRDNIPSLEAGTDNSSRVDTVDATGASFSEQSGNNISDGRGDIRVFEQGLGGKHSWSDADNERDLQREVSQRLVEIAEDNGLFIPLADTKNLGEKYQGRTGESTVYIDEAAGKVYKVKNPYAKSALKKVAPQDAIYEHIVHNLLFPEAPYKFEGISKDVDGVRIVLSQPFINNEDSPSQSQIEQALAASGLYPDGKYSYGNDLVSVTDVEGDNVILGEDGTVYFIDPIIKFKKPATEIIEKLSEQTSDSAAFMIGNFKIVAPEGTSAERWATVVEHLKDIIGADNVITDEEQMRQILNNLLQSGEIRTMIKTKGFYSDAERAVEEIKQEKATPQQWLAMLQKNGGLKAGEDKWIGLSDWLKASEKKTLTKQEVLDYIGVNKIQIEEVEYADSDTDSYIDLSDTPEFQELKDEFEQLRSRIIADEWHKADKYSDSLIEKYGFQNNTIDMEALSDGERDTLTRLQITDREAADLAWVEMLDRYGNDFEIAFDTFVGGLSIKDENAARSLLGISDSTKPINSVRKKYTTVGLNNLREIALTVPTIDSWRKDDNVHFGDAGEGRAIAWIRFGETTAPREVEIVREAVLEAPFKAYNGHDIYRVKDTNGKHFIIYGKLKNGQMMYVPQINGKYIGETVETAAFDTLEQAQEALAAYYKAHPIRKTINERILVIDEIQSNRHQEGRKRGYGIDEKEVAFINARLEQIIEGLKVRGVTVEADINSYRFIDDTDGKPFGTFTKNIPTDERGELIQQYRDAHSKLRVLKSRAIPAAPFERNWAELAFKRMLRYAAENGFDKVAWTTGAQQAERYDLSKDIDYIEAGVNENGTYNINVATTDDSRYLTEKDVTEERLSELVGKEIALAIIQGTQNSQDKKFTLEGDNLQIGGEGMKAFYDNMLVSFMNKYGKKWDARVGEVTMPELDENNTMHAVDVTNAMRISVLEGQPMFRAMKTSKGEVYGFTYNGKIYLDPTTMNVEAPIHEYTELWSAVIEKQNPELWAKGKELLKQTNMWKVVNSDPNYKNLPEDLRASETLSRIVAAEAAKKINEVSDSKNLIAKLRAWIRKFWNTLKATFSKWSAKDIDNLTLREFKAMPLRDFIEGVNPLDYQVSNISGFAPLLDTKELEEIRAERKQIEEQAKANGTWLKAPNGQPTNLTPEQWVTVRTRRFKEWFGDWEKAARIEKLRNSKNVSITGNEFEITDDFKQNKKNALKYSQSFTGEYTNADTGATIAIYRGRQNGGVNEVLQHNYKDIPHIQSIAAIPDIIKNSIYVESQPNNDVEKNPDVAEYQCYVCGLNIAGEDYTVLAKVAVDKKGNRYYDHNLTAVEKGKLIDIANNEQSAVASGFGTTPDTKSTTNSQRKYRELLSILQINSSKIVDANSEPMPVYHGSTADNITEFDKSRIRANETDANYNGFWFSTDEHTSPAWRNAKRIYTVFLNIKNPIVRKDANKVSRTIDYDVIEELQKEGKTVRSLPDATRYKLQQLGYDGVIDFTPAVINEQEFRDAGRTLFVMADGYAHILSQTNDGIVLYEYDPYAENKEGNVEGIYDSLEDFYNDPYYFGESVFVAFEPNQIKSVDNTGTFDSAEDDIRYSQLSALDAEYIEAVRSGDMERAKELVRQYAEIRGYTTSQNFRDAHGAPTATVEKKDFTNAKLINQQSMDDSTDVNLFSLPQGENLAPNDFWSPQGPRWYMYNNDAGMQAYAAISSAIRAINYQLREYGEVRNIPTVKVYRAVPNSIEATVLQNGDWVTPSKLYADRHGKARFGFDEYKIIEQEVPATELWWDGNDAREWGYDNGNVEATANTPNNVKLLDPITYDDEGNIIPLSSRFDKSVADPRFMFVGEKGAAAMDAAEEATIRLDNLAVAREMEDKFTDNKLLYVNKEKALNYFSDSAPIAEAQNNQELVSTTKVIQNFDNPTITPQNIAKKIKLATGWERGADGKWRYEVPDVEVNQNAMFTFKDDGSAVTILSSLVNSEELFAAYPELEDMPVVFREMEPGLEGGYYDGLRQIHLSDAFLRRENPELNTKQEISGEDTIAHEIQHAIQDIEGFARGGHWELRKPDTTDHKHLRDIVRGAISFVEFFQNSDLAQTIREAKKYNWPQWESIGPEAQEILLEYLGHKRKVDYKDLREYLSRAFDMTFPRKYGKNGYRKFAGEVEARNVEARMNMTPEQRRESLASETQDVATEDQIFLYHGMGVSEKRSAADNSQTPPATAKENSLQSKVEELRAQLQDNKNNLKSVLINIYDFMTSADIVNAMESGIGRGRYRAVLKNITTAISQAYGKSDMNIVRNILDKYLSNIEDALSQQLARQRLLEVKDILNTSIVGYTPQGVRYGKRIDESTRELFDIIRNAIAVEAPEEFTDDGRRKPVAYRLKGYTVDGDISTSFRLITDGSINKVEDTIDDIFAIAEGTPSSEEVMRAARLQYVNNILDRYDRTLEINQQIGEITNELNDLEGRLAIATTEHRNAPESAKKERWADVKTLRNEKESLIQKRAQLRKSYASRLKVFTIGLKNLIENGVALNEAEEGKRAEEDIKFRAGIYASIKQKGVLIYASPDYDASGKKKPKKTAHKHLRGLVYENPFIATFEQKSRDIDVNSIPGQWLRSGWYYQFILGENGWLARNDWRYNTEQTLHKELTNKVKEIFGKSIIFKDKAKAVSFDIYNAVANKAQMDSGYRFERLVPKLKDGKIVGGIQDNVPLTIAQLLYIRNTCRQPNGRSGYYAWNISDFALDALINYVEANYPEYCQFADWVVSTYLPKLYEMQDAIYYKIYNTHLTKTKFYFPFVRDKRFVGTLAEAGSNAVTLPSSTIGNIVERVNTTSRMDLTADMFSVLQTHTTETLDWCAYSELTRKFNMFVTSKYFNNLMGEQDYSVSKLKQVFEIAIGQGQINSADNGAMTKVLNTVSKGLVAGNMVLNFNAALKQAVSMTATLGYSLNPEFEALWLKNYFTPSFIKLGFANIIQMIKDGTLDPRESIDIKAFGDNWKWAIKNIPTLRERWEGKGVGFEQLKANGFEKWDRAINKITEWGLSPNALMDMLTCANGAKAIYEFEYPRNIKRGLNPEEAHRDACAKAAVFINRTQQSSLNAFLASFQAGSGLNRILGTGLNAYQNSSMAFARNEWDTLRHIIRMLNKGNKAQMVNNKTDEYKAQGVEAKEAEILAKKDFREAFASQVGGFLHSAIISNFMWTLATPMSGIVAAAASSILNWDDDEWEKFWQNESVRKQFAEAVSLETLAWQMPLVYNHPILKQLLEFARQSTSGMSYGSLFQSPVVQDAQELVEAITKQWVGVLDEATGEYKKQDPTRYDRSVEYILFSILLKSGTTVSSDVIDRMRIGIMGMIEDGEVNTEDIMNILSSPRALTRSIAGEKRANESQQEYLDRISFIHRMVNAGSGAYDDKWERERINEYLFAKDKPLYISVGIDPLDVKRAEKQAKAISKMLLIRKVGNKAIPKEGKLEVWKALSDQQKHQQIELLKLRTKIGYIDKSLLRIGLSDEDRTKLLKQRYELLVEFHNNWTKYIK